MNKYYKASITLLILVLIFYTLLPTPKMLGISNASCEVTPNVITLYGNFTIRFNVGSAIPGGGWIKVSFPNEFDLPCNCGGVGWSKSDFLINGVYPADAPDGNNGTNMKYVRLTLPASMNISQGSVVVLQIREAAKIRNPDKPGMYSLKISTSSETTEVATSPFEIGYSSVTNTSLSLLSNTVASQTGVVVGFKTGLLGELSEGDYIYIAFDDGFSLPGTISTNRMRVNGYRPLEARVKGKILMIAPPKGMKISNSTQVVMEIEQAAGIVNPISPGLYGVYIYTDKEPKKARSNLVEVRDKPFVKTEILTIPENPDGENGFYRMQPVIVLLPQTNTSEQVETYYRFDSQQEQLYTSPIYVPEGIHTLYCYSRSASAIEEIRSIDFKVDLASPNISIISPDNNAIFSQPKVSFRITVSDVSPIVLTIKGKAIVPNARNEYIADFDLVEGQNDFTIKAEDLAGNVSEEQIRVFLYTVSPEIKIVSPTNFQVFIDSNIFVRGVVSPTSDTKLEINGAEVSFDENGAFEFALTLGNEGMNVINVVARHNLSGKQVSTTIVVYYKPVVMKKEITVVLNIGKKEAMVDGEKRILDVAPYIDSTTNRTLVPLRFISEAFGGKVDWDAQNKTITISINSNNIILQVGNLDAFVNGKFVKLEQSPVVKEGRTMVPIRFISESLGAQVSWDGVSNTITIVLPLLQV